MCSSQAQMTNLFEISQMTHNFIKLHIKFYLTMADQLVHGKIYATNLKDCSPDKILEKSQVRICRAAPPPSELTIFTWKMRNVLKWMKNQFSDFYFLSYDWFCSQFSSAFTDQKWLKIMLSHKMRNVLKRIFELLSFFGRLSKFQSGYIYMKDEECAEMNEKTNFPIFIFFSYGRFCTQN